MRVPRNPGITLLLLAIATAESRAEDWKPPRAAATLEEFELAYPKSEATAAALELERLAAAMGVDLAPDIPTRSHPESDAAKARAKIGFPIATYLDGELESPQQRIAPLPEDVARFLSERQAAIDSIRTRLLRREEVAWALDYQQATFTPAVNLLGVVHLQRFLAVSALSQAARGDPEEALETLDAMWRLAQSMASRPELISQLITLNGIRFVVGVLRKLDVAAPGWEERMRSRSFFEAYLAALQNDHWLFPRSEDEESRELRAGAARMRVRFLEGLSARSACDWSPEALRRAWEVAASGESPDVQIVGGMLSDNLNDGLARWHRLLLDSELTALVVEARAERAASREKKWPAKLWNLESSACPGSFWSYRVEKGGTAAFAFEGRVPTQEETHGAVLPLTFRAGTPAPTRTPTPLTHPTPTRTLPTS
jgi:hypothetical protein